MQPFSAAAQTNGVLREFYSGIGNGSIQAFTNSPSFPASPTSEFIETAFFEAPSSIADNYGQRMRALLLPPVSGNYVFYIATDDQGALFLSSDETPNNRVKIASIPTWSGSRVWQEPRDGNDLAQKSAPIFLTAGNRYYIEALQTEGGGGDNLAVAWQKPGDPVPANGSDPIPGTFLLPFGIAPPIIATQPANISVIEGNIATFSVQLARMLGATFQWSRNGTNIPGATFNTYSLGPVTLADTTNRFRCFIANSLGTTNSNEAILTVVADTTKPTLSAVGNIGENQIVFVVFSEPVEADSAANAANYAINNGIGVTRATFGVDSRTIILTTTPMAQNVTYTLTVSNVRDRASVPNTILLNSTKTFSLISAPLDVGFLSLPKEQLGPSSRRHGVVISEVMYHPTNRTDGRNLEFIEIFNAQPWFEEIGGWRIAGAIDYTFPANTILQPRSFLVVAAVPADLQAIYGGAGVLGPFANTNGLQNSSGTLRLRNARDAVLFEMNYSGDPPYPVAADGGGHSLVLARPSYGEADPRAWAASDVIGGTPRTNEVAGTNPFRTILINEFLAHTDPPLEDYIELYNYGAASVNIGRCVLTDNPETNKFILPANTVIPSRGFVAFTESQLGFSLSAAGEDIFLKNTNGTRILDAVRFGAQENGVASGRYPDGAPSFTRLATRTPGTNNARFKAKDVVINEIMFDPVTGDSDDEYIELYNRSANLLNLGGWRIRDAVSYNIPANTFLPSGGYLVIAKNAVHLRTNYAGLTAVKCLGNYSGSLANGGERVALNFPDEIAGTNQFGMLETNTIHITLDEVTYGPGGRWGAYAGGGGSSLELKDAHADNRLAPNWADSDESAKSAWVTVQATGVMDNGWADAYQLHVTLQGAGEALIDDVQVIPAGGTNVIGNGTFESGADGWVFQGNHNQTTGEPNEGCNSARSLHLRAKGRGDSGANRVRTQLPYTLSPGTTVTLRAKVRWLKGNPNILLRLRGNWLEAPGYILTAKNLGTPGALNSRAVANIGPSITDVRHSPPLPAVSQTVLVTARVNDPDGLAFLAVNYRIDPGINYVTVAMTNNGAGLFSANLPGQAAGGTAAFYIQASDNFSTPASVRFPDDAPARECIVRWGDNTIPGNGTLGTYRFWLSQTNVSRWTLEEKMSNNPKDVTFLYGTNRIIYNASAWFHGSPYHSPSYDSPVGSGCDYDMGFPPDDRFLGAMDLNLFRPGNGGGDGTAQAEIHGYWFGGQFGAPFLYHRPVFVFVNGVQREFFHDAQQPNGDFVNQWFPDDAGGDLHKIQIGFEFGDLAYGANEPGYSAVGADLNRYLTTGGRFKQARYRATWQRRSASISEQNDYTNIFNLVNTVLTPAAIGSDTYTSVLTNAVDVAEWFKIHVTQHLYNNYDSFSYGGGQNAFAYKPRQDGWKLLLWDVDFAFGGDPNDANLFGIGGAEHGPRNDHPPFLRIYWQALIEAANGMMTPARSDTILDARYTGMVAAGAPIGSPAGIKSFIATRRSLILGQIAANQSPFAIQSNGGADFTTNRNLITLTGTAPLEVRTILVNGVAYPVTWTALSSWLIRVPLSSGTNTLVITGVDPKGVLVAGSSGTIRVNYTGANELPQDKLVINEIMYHPAVPNAEFVEIYNTSASNAFDLSGWRLTGVDFNFPAGAVIDAGKFIVVAKDALVFSSTYGSAIPVIGEFAGQLDDSGETLKLIKPGATSALDQIIDQVTFDSARPWPAAANGGGASLQLIDPAQDNNRVGNWAAVPTNAPPPPPQWQYVVANGTLSRSLLYVYLQTAGDVYIDDIKLVAGNVAEAGANVLTNGDFEAPLSGPWTIGSDGNNSASTISTAVKHSGSSSLHLIASAFGTTQNGSIWQTFGPGVTNAPYTLSFWYLPSPNGGPLTIRLSGSGIRVDVNLAPPGFTNALRFTPGAVNSVRSTLPAFPALWLNEILPNNVSGNTDRFGHHHPWVELYNSGTNTINLGGWFLANNYSNLTQWPFPAGTTLNPTQFLVVWLDGNISESTNTEFHAGVTIPPDLGSIALTQTNSSGTNILDYLNYSVATAGRSYGDYPDGNVSGRQLFGLITPGATNNPTFPPITVFINEWMAANATFLADPADGDPPQFDDWFELYNPGSGPVDISDYYLADSLTNKTQWKIPGGAVIPAHGYLLVWADNTTAQNGFNPDLHANFKLSSAGETIGLFAPDGQLIDAVIFAAQITDVSQGRFPDGSASISFMTNPTPRTANMIPSPNLAPTLLAIADKTVNEGSLLSFTSAALDANVPAQSLTWSLDPGYPFGAGINPTNGLFGWVPNEAQGPGVYTITVRVTDDGSPPMTSTNTFKVTVNEVNNAPSLAPVSGRTINEGTQLVLTNSATDPDGDATVFAFSLDGVPPAGMTINATNGVLTWTPSEAQGPGTYNITVRVTDNGAPPLSGITSFTIFVNEVNNPPDLTPVASQTNHLGYTFTFTASASDTDSPPQTLRYSLDGVPPAGASLTTNGVFTWTPAPAQAPSVNPMTLRVTDGGSPPLSATRNFTITVLAALNITSVQSVTNTVTITWNSIPGRAYRLQSTTNLSDVAWADLGASIPAAGSTTSATDSNAPGSQRFYRVSVLP